MKWYDEPQKVLRYLWMIPRLMLIVIGPLSGLLDTAGGNARLGECRACLYSLHMTAPNVGWATSTSIYSIIGVNNQILRRDEAGWRWDFLPIDGDIAGLSTLDAQDTWALYTNSDFVNNVLTYTSGLLHNHDGHWEQVPGITNQDLSGLAMVSHTEGWAISSQFNEATYHYDSTLAHYQSGGWQTVPLTINTTFTDITFASADDGWVIGEKGFIAHENGEGWQVLHPFSKDTLEAIQVRGSGDIWIMTMQGTIWHGDGITWTPVITDAPRLSLFRPAAFAVVAPDDIWVLQGVRQSEQSASVIWHFTQGHWQQVALPNDYFTSLAMISPHEGWAVGIDVDTRNGDGDVLSGTGVIAHYLNGTWQVSAAPRQAELWWLALSRAAVMAGMLVALGFVGWFTRLSSVLESPSLLKTGYARVALLFTTIGIGGAFLAVGEPLLFPQYNVGAKLIGYGLGLLGIGGALITGALLERKHKRTPKPVPVEDLVIPPMRGSSLS